MDDSWLLPQDWPDAAVIVLSCPGPSGRYSAAILPLAQLAFTQSLLGWEAQLLAIAAAAPPQLRARMVFAPMPEIFDSPLSLLAALRAVDVRISADQIATIVHLRFGGARMARLLKGTRNVLVLAELEKRHLIGQTRNPFADGLTVPAGCHHVFLYEPRRPALAPFYPDGTQPPASVLGEACIGADFGGDQLALAAGFEAVPLNQHKPDRWVSGPPAAITELVRKAGILNLLLPWNLSDPVSAVPEIMLRLCRLRDPAKPAFRVIVLPFNYPGKLALIRTLMRRIKDETVPVMRVPENVLVARAHGEGGIAALRAIRPVAWIDGNDPEHRFSARRLVAAEIPVLMVAAPLKGGDDWGKDVLPRVRCEDEVFVENASSFGTLAINAAMPTPLAIAQGLTRSRAMLKAANGGGFTA